MDKNPDSTKADISLLDAFIVHEIMNYKEPVRKGAPKGQPIGFFYKKYHAALLSLKKASLKQQSDVLKISYGLLRKWRTEDTFKEQIGKMESDFTYRLSTHLIARGEKQKKLSDDYFKRPVEYIARNQPSELTWDEFNDVKYYSPHLVATIVVVFPKLFENLTKRIGKMILDSIDWSDEDFLFLAIYHQVQQFFEFLKVYPFNEKQKTKILDHFKAKDDDAKNLYYKVCLKALAKDWKNSGTVSELVLKKTIWSFYCMAGSFTPVKFND
jgi:hypothetical protein